jgi:hypothetical protein
MEGIPRTVRNAFFSPFDAIFDTTSAKKGLKGLKGHMDHMVHMGSNHA